MSHPLQDIINNAENFLLIGESEGGRFPGLSYSAYSKAGRKFYCLDLDGMTESRGPVKGGRVYTSVEELPAERGELAVIWVLPRTAVRAVEVAHEAGYSKVWFSFKTGHRGGVARARELGMEVVEIGRCPVYYMDDTPGPCKMHTAMVKLSGTWKRAPQLDPDAKRREIL